MDYNNLRSTFLKHPGQVRVTRIQCVRRDWLFYGSGWQKTGFYKNEMDSG